MSDWRDYRVEMYAQQELDDATVEAVLRGGQVPADLEPLAAALDALRTLPGQPVRPSAELAARMATGDFASAAAPRPSRRSAGRYAARRRRRVVPLRAKVAAGSALALAGLASASVAGALPESAQQGVESVIEAVTPFEFNDSSDFGRDVSDDAQDGGVDGQEISDEAQEQGNQPDEAGSGEVPEPGVVSPTQPASRPTATRPENSGGAGLPSDKGRPDGAGRPDSADKPDELPVEPRSTD